MINIYRLNRPPKPTLTSPYTQIEWMFYQVFSEMESKTKGSSVYAMKKYLEFIKDTNGYYDELALDSRFYLDKYWELDALVRFNKWLRKQSLASKTKYAIYKNVRVVMNTAYTMSVIDNVIYNEPFDKGERETENNTAYSEEIEDKIVVAIDKWIYLAARFIDGYKKSNDGIPCKPSRNKYKGGLFIGGINYDSATSLAIAYGLPPSTVQQRLDKGWSPEKAVSFQGGSRSSKSGKSQPVTVEGEPYTSIAKVEKAYGVKNLRHKLAKGYSIEEALGIRPRYSVSGSFEHALWMFENQFECNPEAMLIHVSQNINNMKIRVGDLKVYFMRLGVWIGITRDLVMPLVMKLIYLTGLNLESVKSLTLDSYQESHPLTGQPVITYMKKRSESGMRTIDRELHIPTLEVEEHFLESNIRQEIDGLIKLVVELTEPLRQYSSNDIKNKLFIFELSKAEKKGTGEIHSIDNQILVTGWLNSFPKKNGLVDDKGKPYQFNSTKFRPSIASRMIKQGADIFQVGVVLGHKSISTTARYIDEHRLAPEFNEQLSKAIDGIAKRSIEYKQDNKRAVSTSTNLEPIKTLSGCSCKNPYNPSENVRTATSYQEGSLCKYWNMCLLCDSSFVTESALPKLVNYKLELEEVLGKNSPHIQQKKELVQSTIELISGILQPDEIFPKEVINNAIILASELDDLEIDQLVYQGVIS